MIALVLVLAVTTVAALVLAFWAARDHADHTARIEKLEAKNRTLAETCARVARERAVERMKRRTAEGRLVLTDRTLERENGTVTELCQENNNLAATLASRDHHDALMRLAGRILPDLRDPLELRVFDDGGPSPIFDALRDETWPLIVLPGELLADNLPATLEVAPLPADRRTPMSKLPKIAMVTAANRRPEYPAYYDEREKAWRAFDMAFCVVEPTSIRPLYVFDPEDRKQVEQIAGGEGRLDVDWLHDRLLALARPDDPEPQGLGAVIRDGMGEKWFNRGDIWIHERGAAFPLKWDSLPRPLTVLSTGWEHES